jgi:hypothetical protein
MTGEYYDDKVTSVRVILGAKDPKLGGRHVIQPFRVWKLEKKYRAWSKGRIQGMDT